MRALITGASGFAGRHLTQHLARATDWELWGTQRPAAVASATATAEVARRSELAGRAPLAPGWAAQYGLRTVPVELTDYASTRALLAESRPDYLFHLAAQ